MTKVSIEYYPLEHFWWNIFQCVLMMWQDQYEIRLLCERSSEILKYSIFSVKHHIVQFYIKQFYHHFSLSNEISASNCITTTRNICIFLSSFRNWFYILSIQTKYSKLSSLLSMVLNFQTLSITIHLLQSTKIQKVFLPQKIRGNLKIIIIIISLH